MIKQRQVPDFPAIVEQMCKNCKGTGKVSQEVAIIDKDNDFDEFEIKTCIQILKSAGMYTKEMTLFGNVRRVVEIINDIRECYSGKLGFSQMSVYDLVESIEQIITSFKGKQYDWKEGWEKDDDCV